jgi:hypothetical protein
MINSALAHVLLGQIKTAIIMLGASFLFGSMYSTTQLLGAAGAVAAIILYSHITIKEKEKRPESEKDVNTIPLLSSATSNSKDTAV